MNSGFHPKTGSTKTELLYAAWLINRKKKKMKKSKRLVVLACVLCLTGFAGAMVSTNYNLNWHVTGGGGGPMSSANYRIDGTVGQIIGVSESANYRLEAGYWYGITAPTLPNATFSLELMTGLNLISLPINDPSITTASLLADKLGSNCTEVVKFNAAQQQLQSYVPGVPLNNFAIAGGEGYFVNLNHPTLVLLTGSGWSSPFLVSLVPGLNLIGMPVNDTAVTTASTLAAKIGTSCQEVVNWGSGTQSYVSYVTGVPLNNFAIRAGNGYFVNVNTPTTVTFIGPPWQD